MHPGYNAPFVARVGHETGLATQVMGMIVRPQQAEEIIASGKAEMVCFARALFDNPRWVWHAAEELNATVHYPPQYKRNRRSARPGAAVLRPLTEERN